jgi:hypothetical protein
MRASPTTTGKNLEFAATSQALVAANSVTVTSQYTIYRVAGSGGAVTLTSTPSVDASVDGKLIILEGTSDANTLTLQDESNLADSDLQLAGGVDITLGLYDQITLMYNSSNGKWQEQSRSDN